MTVIWGSLKVPDLTWRPAKVSDCRDGRHLDGTFGLFHHPTGLRMDQTNSRQERRGDGGTDYLLFGPGDEGWTLRMTVDRAGTALPQKVASHFGMSYRAFNALPLGESLAMEKDYLARKGGTWRCFDVSPEGASPQAYWTPERRDALVMMICFLRERNWYARDPFPSTVDLTDPGIPDAFRGIYRLSLGDAPILAETP